MDSNFIIDVGFHNGDDTAYYLRKGYRVVAIEANPVLAERGRRRFAQEISAERLVLIEAAVAGEAGTVTLWVNRKKDEWSSIHRTIGGRFDTEVDPVEVPAIRFASVIEKYGVPHYLKSDIEQGDIHVLTALRPETAPKFISVEGHGVEYFAILYGLGYRDFKCVDQTRHNTFQLPLTNESVVGRAVRSAAHYYNGVERRVKKLAGLANNDFPHGSSGPFGEETPGPWRPINEVAYEWLHYEHHRHDRGRLNMHSWFDIHARLP